MSPMGLESNGRGPDHDTLLYIKGLQEAFVREVGAKFEQVNKDIYGLTMAVKDVKSEHREDCCKIDKRISPLERSASLLEERLAGSKEDRLKLHHSIAETDADIRDWTMKEIEETREELRRSMVTMGTVAGLIGAVGGSILTVIVMLWIG